MEQKNEESTKVSRNMELACKRTVEFQFGAICRTWSRKFVFHSRGQRICSTKCSWLSHFLERREKISYLKWLFSFSRKYGGKLKQTGNISKLTLLLYLRRRLRWTIGAYLRKNSETFCITVSQYWNIGNGAHSVIPDVFGVSCIGNFCAWQRPSRFFVEVFLLKVA